MSKKNDSAKIEVDKSKRIVLIGNSPLPLDTNGVRSAAGLRTYQFMMALLEAGHSVKLVTLNMSGEVQNDSYFATKDALANVLKSLGREASALQYLDFAKNDKKLKTKLEQELKIYEADLIVSVNTYPSYIACQLKTDLPIWTDLNGWVMAEAQAQAFKLETNAYINHYLEMEDVILKRTDKISVVSNMQRAAIWGELAQKKRLVKETFEYEFVSLVVNATFWLPGEYDLKQKKSKLLEKIDVKAFNIFWLGGYNTWVDEKALFEALEIAMKVSPDIKYVSTGGGIEGLDNKTFASFMQLVNKSEFKDRFTFLGWVDSEDIPSIYTKVSIGINADRTCIETFTGARNRINEMLKFGLPVLTTIGSDISWDVVNFGVGLGVKQENANDLAAGILSLYSFWKNKDKDDEFEVMKERAQDYIEEFCSYSVATVELIEYLKQDKIKRAPDFGIQTAKTKYNLGVLKDYFRQNGWRKFFKKVWQKISW